MLASSTMGVTRFDGSMFFGHGTAVHVKGAVASLANEVNGEASFALLGLGIGLGALFFEGVLVAITGVLNALDRALVTFIGPRPRLLPSGLEV